MTDLKKLTISELNERVEQPEHFTPSFSHNPVSIARVRQHAKEELLLRQNASRTASAVLAHREEAAAKLASQLAAPGADWSLDGSKNDLVDALNYYRAQIATAMAIPRDKLNTAPDWLQTSKTETSAPEPAVLNLNAKRNIRLE